MKSVRNIFNSAAAKKVLMFAAITIGAAGLLSGAWMAATGGASAAAGLIGGAVTLGIGFAGLSAIKHAPR